MRLHEDAEAAVEGLALGLVNALARARKVSPHHLALLVPGLCHAHCPDRRAAVPGCAYCARRGNCFADGLADGRAHGAPAP